MSGSDPRTDTSSSILKSLLLVLVGGIAVVDLGLAVVTPAPTQPVRLLLAGCALCVPLLAIAIGSSTDRHTALGPSSRCRL